MQWLEQSTAVTLKIGPFLDETDGKTAETGLTITQAEVRLSKNGGDIAQKSEGANCTHDELGIYGCPIDTTDTGTLGRLQLWVHESGALPVWHEYMVVPANVWDSMFGADKLQVDVVEVSSDATAADDLELLVENCKGTDHKVLISTDVQDLNASLHVDAKAISGATAAADSVESNIGNLDHSVATVDTVADAIKAVTDVLPDAGALNDLALILTDTGELQTDWTDGGRLDLLLDAISAVAIADAVLKRGVDNVEDAADADSLAAVILKEMHAAISGTTLTIYKVDDTTPFDTKTITKDASADPVTSIADP